jgi:phosphate starvation-inducible PhoH-like protein
MRGRTLNNAFAILDEAQNSSIMQMKMFLTRLGVNAKAIVTGDITQIDLEDPDRSGLVAVREILQDVEGIKFITFGEEDVVRHRLVKNIIRAFSSIGSRLSRAAHGDETGCDCSAGGSSDDILSVTEETDE